MIRHEPAQRCDEAASASPGNAGAVVGTREGDRAAIGDDDQLPGRAHFVER